MCLLLQVGVNIRLKCKLKCYTLEGVEVAGVGQGEERNLINCFPVMASP